MHRINLSEHWTRRGSVWTRRFGSPRSTGGGVWLVATLPAGGTLTVNGHRFVANAGETLRVDITHLLTASNHAEIDGTVGDVAMEIHDNA